METPEKGGSSLCVGHIIVYVDDMMVMADDGVRKAFFERLQQEWKCSENETVGTENWVRFCGFEMKRHENGVGLLVGQKSYTLDLLKRHKDVTPKSYPMPKGEVVGSDEENPTIEDIRRGQAITGELLWLAGRSRPDISYAVSTMGRAVLKRPKWVQQIGKHVLGFLSNTQNVCLLYQPCCKDHGIYGTLQVPRHERLLEAFADISYAPEGDRSHQGIIICAAGSPIQWEATRQAFHTMSTSESELVGYCEATTMLKSTEALMKVIHGPITNDDDPGFEKVIYGDNTSALSILTNPDGGWRTRHLRLRSACLRELLRDEPQNWKIRHQKGSDLPADMLTKPIIVQKEWARFWCFLGFHVDSVQGKISSLNIENLPPHQPFHKALVNPSELPEVSKECDDAKDSMLQLKVVAMIAALAAVANRCDVTPKLEVACAAGAVAFARWLAEGEPTQLRSDRPKEVCSEGREEEETIRAIGLQKIVKKSQDARGDEPAKTNLPRENEPGSKKDFSKENELGELRPDNQLALHKKEKESELAKIGLKRVFVKPLGGRDNSFVEANSQGSAQHTKTNDEPSSCRDLSRPSEVSSTHHCPTGCPFSSRLSSAVEAMPSSNGPGLETGIGHGSSTIGWSTAEPTGPWHHGKYLYSPPVKSQDAWTFVQVGTQQYWVRTHHLHRIQPFHPVHRNQPVQASDLSSRRVTIKFEIGGSGRPERVFDHWTDRSEGHEWSTREGKRWCGYTFFEMKNNKKDVNKIDHERTNGSAIRGPRRTSGFWFPSCQRLHGWRHGENRRN